MVCRIANASKRKIVTSKRIEWRRRRRSEERQGSKFSLLLRKHENDLSGTRFSSFFFNHCMALLNCSNDTRGFKWFYRIFFSLSTLSVIFETFLGLPISQNLILFRYHLSIHLCLYRLTRVHVISGYLTHTPYNQCWMLYVKWPDRYKSWYECIQSSWRPKTKLQISTSIKIFEILCHCRWKIIILCHAHNVTIISYR